MKILGITPAKAHDPSAALMIDGKIIAAAEEERFNRIKHSTDHNPVNAVKYCLDTAGISMNDIDAIAFCRSFDLAKKMRWRYAWRMRKYPFYALTSIRRVERHNRTYKKDAEKLLQEFGCNLKNMQFHPVEHHMAHLSSAYHLSNFDDAAVMSFDGKGEFTSVLLGHGKDGKITKINEYIVPDSLGYFYSLITRHLGFRPNNGEFKVMGMSPYGDPSKIDLSDMITTGSGTFRLNEDYIWPLISMNRHKSYSRSKDLTDLLGPMRKGDGLSEPYIHIAAAAQKTLEDTIINIVRTQLSDTLKSCGGRLCFAGGTALNVRLNRKLLDMSEINEMFVQPAAHDAGTSLGAASYIASELGEKVEPMKHAYLGPEFSNDSIKEVLEKFRLPSTYYENIEEETAKILANGKIVAWFQGRMEYGPRALGNRSILANPATPGVADEVNGRIKFREKWRPFCPSILADRAPEIIQTKHNSDYMTFSFIIEKEWAKKVPEIVHVDGSARPQTVREETNPRFYKLISEFDKLTDIPILLNTSLNRRGEPMVCSPEEAIAMFYQCGLEFLVMGNYLIKK